MAADLKPDISVVICTRNRAESLHETLGWLEKSDRTGLDAAVVVVDNASCDNTAEMVRKTAWNLPVQYLYEPEPGKAHALNRALDEGPIGGIIAVLDDDMSPQVGWFAGVKSICDRWPNKDLFTGKSHIIWPRGDVPDWCLRAGLRGWAYSVVDGGALDKPLAAGRWFSGNHFWFRSRVLAGGRRFRNLWATEPQFMLQLLEDGYEGVSGPDAECGHRIQPELLRLDVIQRRAQQVGRGFAAARLQPYKDKVRQAQLLRRHRRLGQFYCLAALVGWGISYMASMGNPSRGGRIGMRLNAIERMATYREYLRIVAEDEQYSI